MPAIHELAELAPRDIVAQSIYGQMRKYNQDFVWLSLKHLDPEAIKRRFPTIYEKCKELGIDMCDRIPVAPAAHYMVGGVRTDLNGQTNIRNLYICGELASSGIMGANRLASNSLIECLVFGKRAVEASRQYQQTEKTPHFTTRYHYNEQYAPRYIQLKQQISKLMTVHAGIIRNAALLQEGLKQLEELEKEIPSEENEYYSLISHNLITVARLIICSALFRQESRGGHFREDFPQSNEQYLFHIVQQKDKEIKTIPIDVNM